MIKNRELFYQDPKETEIPNLGVAKVKNPEDQGEWRTLEWELKSFVCEGEYERGLERILDSFLTHLSRPEQPAVWVSGFYGSGKSHLVRVLEYLWRDVRLVSGETARSLTSLPGDIQQHLIELSNAGKRAGGLWSAAGTLGAGSSESVRLAFLAVILDAAGLPAQYGPARFVIWLKQNDLFEVVREEIEAQGKDLHRELRNMYVSPYLAQALLTARPTFADSVEEVSRRLQAQYPDLRDLSYRELFDVFEEVLELQSNTAGRLPLTVVVLDEMQQYIDDDNNRALIVQDIVEGCQARFESQVMFVATGQSDLTATPTLQKLTDRFAIKVALSDSDVETVIRQVILRKKADQISPLRSQLEQVSGEIDRHLGGTRIGSVARDKQELVADYPLLPTRRRFWELALRAIDKGGKAGVLRTQLKIVHEATQEIADDPVGHVVGADFIYDQQSAGMLMSGALLREIDELVRSQRDGTEDGTLKSRLCALVFLISQLPRVGGGDSGVRATAPFLADLLVEDLEQDGARLRKRVPELLEDLAAAGRLLKVEEEYLLQTHEGAEWTKDFNRRRAAIRDDVARMTQLRHEWLLRAVDQALGGIQLQQGSSKTPRRFKQHWGQDEPTGDGVDVPIWIRDEWSVTLSAVKSVAAQAGDKSPVVYVFLPRRNADAIKDALSSYAAALETIQQKPIPQTDEGRAARSAMETRRRTDEEQLARLFDDVVANARVFQGGGNELTVTNLRDAAQTAAEHALVRLFGKFSTADDARWGNVVSRAREGAPDALIAVGHHGEVINHPVCKEILAAVSGAGIKGSDLQKNYSDPPYGWPKDAINGALLTLLVGGHIRAEQDGARLGSAKELQPHQIGKTTFYKEDQPPTTSERLAVKGLLVEARIVYEPGHEGSAIPALLQKLVDLADSAGGPAPLPDRPNTSHIVALSGMAGNQQFRAVAEQHDQLRGDLQTWQKAAERREQREIEWNELERLLRHAERLDIPAEIRRQCEAIETGRQLLVEPDPVKPLLDDLTDVLRFQLRACFEGLETARADALAGLEEFDEWQRLEATDRDQILRQVGLSSFSPPDISTDAALLRVLDNTPLRSWEERIEFIGARAQHARELAVKKLEPKSVSVKPPAATLRSSDDVERYLDQLRELLMNHINAEESIVI